MRRVGLEINIGGLCSGAADIEKCILIPSGQAAGGRGHDQAKIRATTAA